MESKKSKEDMIGAKVWEEQVMIPTYCVGQPEKNPIFLEKRVYQGSSGKVYPYPTIEKISNEKQDMPYQAVWLENQYLKVMVLPGLGGRIQRAYDKTNGYDFVYYNQVIKPALVGLTGPWISGGIEFNWPQHHRPTTFLPVDYLVGQGEDGSAYVLLHDVDQMYGTKGLTKIALYPGKAYIEITGQLYNRTCLPQTFLWWANPAVAVNENTQSVFPPDVHAVMDHGKRDVSSFPIATGIYYKHDYREGVDISRYQNIPVPTSYMAEKSAYDFVGGYDYGKRAGLLHVADHHISPGKKQWTWGCGDFGKAWDRNLTDEDGPYVELMTGVYTDNQPDFTWLKPFEEKVFRQYFMPYKEIGYVTNATKEAAVRLALEETGVSLAVYATEVVEGAEIVLTYEGRECLREKVNLSPEHVYSRILDERVVSENREQIRESGLCLAVWSKDVCLVFCQPEEPQTGKLPEPARAAEKPWKIQTNEELYLTGLHIEQYRHATYLPDPYYLEGLKRDPGDIRINNAYGSLLMRRGQFEEAEQYFRTAIERLTWRNPNPYNSESYYLLGLVLFYQSRLEDAYEAFFKATWTNEQQEMSFYYLAAIDARRGRYGRALEMTEKSLVKNAHNVKARGLKAYLLRKLDRKDQAAGWVAENLALDPFDYVSGYEQVLLEAGSPERADCLGILRKKMRDFPENYLMTARDYGESGGYEEAIGLLGQCGQRYPLLKYYEAYYRNCLYIEKTAENQDTAGSPECAGNQEAAGLPESTGNVGGQKEQISRQITALLQEAESCCPDYCFPNKLEDIQVLRFAASYPGSSKAHYYLGNLFYDKLQCEEAIGLWEKSAAEDPDFPVTHRNLALAYYNKRGDGKRAKEELERAFVLDPSDARVFLELDQLYKKLGSSYEERLERYEKHRELIEDRDDLYVEYITLLNMTGRYQEAYRCMGGRIFHPWEGGEGKITAQYTLCLLQMAKAAMAEKHPGHAEQLLREALVYPENLGEGRLEGTKDNHIYYLLGAALEAQGKGKEAAECYTKASVGTDEPAGAMYYNDQPADMIYYQGLALLKLGREKDAKARFYRLMDYAGQHMEDQMEIEYFAVSLPDFLIFEEDLTVKNKAHCNYLLALGNLGLQNREKAREYLKKALSLEPSHMMAAVYLTDVEKEWNSF